MALVSKKIALIGTDTKVLANSQLMSSSNLYRNAKATRKVVTSDK